jgi:hypothetical protein
VKPLLLLVLIVFSLTPSQQTVERENPDLLVVKFSWARERQKTSIIGGKGSAGAISAPTVNNRDPATRRADIKNLERRAAASSVETRGENYRLRIEVENTGTNVVTNLVWEFKHASGFDDNDPKQYLCALQVRPKERKTLDLLTRYAPVKVISVDASAAALKEGEVIINQIEYADGSVWKRRGWYYKLPADASQKLSEGRCSVFGVR